MIHPKIENTGEVREGGGLLGGKLEVSVSG